MGKDKKQTVNTSSTSTQQGQSSNQIDKASQDYIQNFLRPLGKDAVNQIMGMGPLFGGVTDTFKEGVGATQGALGGLQGLMQQLQGTQGQDFNSALRNYQSNVGETGFQPGQVDDGGAMGLFNRFRSEFEQSGGGGIGFDPQAFDPSQARRFFSPFQDEVVGSVQANADRQREQALSRAASEATSRGAFGGSRSGILQSESLRNVNQDEAAQVAQLKNTGFQNAMGQAMGAHQAHQGNALQAAMADQQGRLSGRGQMIGAGMQAAGLGQRGQMHQNEIGLRTALGDMQGRTTDAGLGLRRAQGLQAGQIESGRQGLQGLAQGMQGIGMQGQLGGQLAGMGETERQVGNQQRQDQLFKLQQALGFGQGAYGGPLGQSSQFSGSSQTQGTQEQIQQGNLLGDLMGGAMTLGGLGAFGPIGGAIRGLFGGGDGGGPVTSFATPADVLGGFDVWGGLPSGGMGLPGLNQLGF